MNGAFDLKGRSYRAVVRRRPAWPFVMDRRLLVSDDCPYWPLSRTATSLAVWIFPATPSVGLDRRVTFLVAMLAVDDCQFAITPR